MKYFTLSLKVRANILDIEIKFLRNCNLTAHHTRVLKTNALLERTVFNLV